MIKSLITPPAGPSTGSWVDCFGTKKITTQFRVDFSEKKRELKQKHLSRGTLQGTGINLSRQQMLLRKRIFLSGSWNLCRVAILVPEHVAFKTEILLFKPFQDKWLFTGCFLTIYSLKHKDPLIPLSNHYRA